MCCFLWLEKQSLVVWPLRKRVTVWFWSFPVSHSLFPEQCTHSSHVSSRPAGGQKLLWHSASNWCAVHQESDQKYLFLFYSTSLLCLFPVRNVAVDLWQLCVQRYNSVSSVGFENTSNILIWRALIGTPWLPGCTFLVFPFSSGIPTAFPCLHCHSLLSHLISEVPLSAFVLETWKSLP